LIYKKKNQYESINIRKISYLIIFPGFISGKTLFLFVLEFVLCKVSLGILIFLCFAFSCPMRLVKVRNIFSLVYQRNIFFQHFSCLNAFHTHLCLNKGFYFCFYFIRLRLICFMHFHYWKFLSL